MKVIFDIKNVVIIVEKLRYRPAYVVLLISATMLMTQLDQVG